MADDLLKKAEQEVVEAAMKWADEQASVTKAPSSVTSQQLRVACYMLKKVRHITGNVRVADVMKAVRESEERERLEAEKKKDDK